MQPFHHAIGDEFVVFRCAQVFRHSFKRHQEAHEILILVESLAGGQIGIPHTVSLAKFKKGSGLDRAFQMEMQLRFRQRAEKSAGCGSRHTAILPDSGRPRVQAKMAPDL